MLRRAKVEPPDSSGTDMCFLPLLYAIWGPFDLAAIYLQRSHVLYTPGPELARVGEAIDTCVLPKPPEEGLADLNLDYLSAAKKRWEQWSQSAKGETVRPPANDPQYRFLSIIQIKLAPHLTLPEKRLGAQGHTFRAALAACWSSAEDWRRTVTDKDRYTPLVAIGLPFSWNEVVIVAHAAEPSRLMELTINCRRLRGERQRAHACLTTVSTLGYDFQIDCEATRIIESEETLRVSRHHEDNVRSVQRLAAIVQQEYPPDSDPSPNLPASPITVTLESVFSVNPGHERWIAEFRAAVEEHFGVAKGSDCQAAFGFGKLDLAGPGILLSRRPRKKSEMTAAQAALFTALFQHAVMVGPDGVGHSAVNYTHAITRVNALVPWAQSSFDGTIEDHTEQDPRDRLVPNWEPGALNNVLRGLHLRDTLRHLQVGYSRLEQFNNILTHMGWAWDSLLTWEDALELAPALCALDCHLKRLVRYIEAKRSRNPGDCRRRLLELQHDLDTLQWALRSVIHNRHWSSYQLADQIDFNPRYRGSIQRLLSMTNMLACSLIWRLMGDRASLVTLGDVTSPTLQQACGVIVIRMQTGVVDVPIHLDSIAHEVGHELLRELLKYRSASPAFAHSWRNNYTNYDGFLKLQERLDALDVIAFNESLGTDRIFPEVVSDFVEMMALWPGEPACTLGKPSFEEWVQSFMLRTCLVARSIEVGRDFRSVHQDRELVASQMVRVMQSRIALLLCDSEAFVEGNDVEFGRFDEFRSHVVRELSDLRERLRRCAVIPLGVSIEDLLGEDLWGHHLMEDVITCAKWIRSPQTANEARLFFIELRDYVRKACRTDRNGITWSELARILAGLRKAYLEVTRTVVMGMTWSTEAERAIENRCHAYDASVRPLNADGTSEDVGAIVSPRDRIIPVGSHFTEKLASATTLFYSSLMERLPAWRMDVGEMLLRRASGD